jgi:hypothetical protein
MRLSSYSVLLLVLTAAGAAFAEPATPATAPTLLLAVSPAGQITVTLGTRVVADGSLYLEYFPPAAPLPAGQLDLGRPVEVTGSLVSPGHASVVYRYTKFVATYDYTLAGEDLRVSAKLQNKDPAAALGGVVFAALKFHFEHDPAGTLPWWHYSYRNAHTRDQIYHPSTATPVGCVYAADEHLGVSLFSESEFDHQDLISAVWVKDYVIPAECQTEFFTDRTVPAGQTVDIDLVCRITTDPSERHLLEPYKKVYERHFPHLFYQPDNRAVVQYSSAAQVHVTPANPLGYNGSFRRMDGPNGALAYIRTVLPTLKQADALGVIFWDPGGLNSVMYQPDFDVFPRTVQPNIAVLADAFKQSGLRMGLCARCGDGVRRPAGKPPEVYRLSPDNPSDMKTVLDRFRHAMDMGFDMFYLDSFGASGMDDLRMLKLYRATVGPHVLFYTETSTDMSLPYAGAYAEWLGTATTWTSPQTYAAMRYLCPDSTWLVISRTKQEIPPAFAELKMTPLVQDQDLQDLLSWRGKNKP